MSFLWDKYRLVHMLIDEPMEFCRLPDSYCLRLTTPHIDATNLLSTHHIGKRCSLVMKRDKWMCFLCSWKNCWFLCSPRALSSFPIMGVSNGSSGGESSWIVSFLSPKPSRTFFSKFSHSSAPGLDNQQ